MGLFNRRKTNYVGEMREFLRKFMMQYITDNPYASDSVIPIFSDAELMIRGSSEKEMCEMLKENNVNIEFGVLNIIQNFAMVYVKPRSAAELIRLEDHALNLYNFVNNAKYESGYISKQQFDENRMLGVKLGLKPPLGEWY